MNTAAFPQSLDVIRHLIFDRLELKMTNPEKQEGTDYSAFAFELNGRRVLFRDAKVTSKKIGQFVTLWKRDRNGVTQPFDVSDGIDLIVVNTAFKNQLGQFVFPESALLDQGVFKRNKEGKRGIRVYPSWDIPLNKQAERTQRWQLEYFLDLTNKANIDYDFVRRLYAE